MFASNHYELGQQIGDILFKAGFGPFSVVHQTTQDIVNLIANDSIVNSENAHVECILEENNPQDMTTESNNQSEEKMFQCNQCLKSYKVKYHLTAHIKYVHSPERAFECEYCEKSFPTRSHRRKHYKSNHKFSSDFLEKNDV